MILVTVLDALARAIVEHNRRLLVGEPVDWDSLTTRLGGTERPDTSPIYE